MGKLFVQVSVDWSVAAKFVFAKLLPFPDTSVPKAELSAKFKWNPFVPKVKPDTDLGFQIVGVSSSNSPNDVGSWATPSIPTTSQK